MKNVRSTFRPLTWAFVAMLLGLVLGFSAPKLMAASSGPAPQVYVVVAGDRLWDLADRFDPDEDPRRFVQQVRDLNDLTSSAIVPGQKLFLPSG